MRGSGFFMEKEVFDAWGVRVLYNEEKMKGWRL